MMNDLDHFKCFMAIPHQCYYLLTYSFSLLHHICYPLHSLTCQTFENVLAQGGLEYRKRMVSKEAAFRLLFIAQSNSRNESIQASCGMALAHMLQLVVTTNHYISATCILSSPGDASTLSLNNSTVAGTGAGNGNGNGNGNGTPSGRRLAGTGPLARANATKGGTIRGDVLTQAPSSPSKPLSGSGTVTLGVLGTTQTIVSTVCSLSSTRVLIPYIICDNLSCQYHIYLCVYTCTT